MSKEQYQLTTLKKQLYSPHLIKRELQIIDEQLKRKQMFIDAIKATVQEKQLSEQQQTEVNQSSAERPLEDSGANPNLDQNKIYKGDQLKDIVQKLKAQENTVKAFKSTIQPKGKSLGLDSHNFDDISKQKASNLKNLPNIENQNRKTQYQDSSANNNNSHMDFLKNQFSTNDQSRASSFKASKRPNDGQIMNIVTQFRNRKGNSTTGREQMITDSDAINSSQQTLNDYQNNTPMIARQNIKIHGEVELKQRKYKSNNTSTTHLTVQQFDEQQSINKHSKIKANFAQKQVNSMTNQQSKDNEIQQIQNQVLIQKPKSVVYQEDYGVKSHEISQSIQSPIMKPMVVGRRSSKNNFDSQEIDHLIKLADNYHKDYLDVTSINSKQSKRSNSTIRNAKNDVNDFIKGMSQLHQQKQMFRQKIVKEILSPSNMMAVDQQIDNRKKEILYKNKWANLS